MRRANELRSNAADTTANMSEKNRTNYVPHENPSSSSSLTRSSVMEDFFPRSMSRRWNLCVCTHLNRERSSRQRREVLRCESIHAATQTLPLHSRSNATPTIDACRNARTVLVSCWTQSVLGPCNVRAGPGTPGERRSARSTCPGGPARVCDRRQNEVSEMEASVK